MKGLEELVNSETVNEKSVELVEPKSTVEEGKVHEKLNFEFFKVAPTNFIELLVRLADAEYAYKNLKFILEQKFNSELISIDWNEINEERKKLELPKLGNQDMKEAFIKDSLREEYSELNSLELEYYKLKRAYDVALKYSIDVLR